MVTLTERAAGEVTGLLEQQGKEDHGLRIWVAGGGCSGFEYGMALDNEPAEDDLSFESNGVRVLVDPQSHPFLDGAEIDFVETVMGGGFRVNNPNAPAGCCGSDSDGCSSGCSGCGSDES